MEASQWSDASRKKGSLNPRSQWFIPGLNKTGYPSLPTRSGNTSTAKTAAGRVLPAQESRGSRADKAEPKISASLHLPVSTNSTSPRATNITSACGPSVAAAAAAAAVSSSSQDTSAGIATRLVTSIGQTAKLSEQPAEPKEEPTTPKKEFAAPKKDPAAPEAEPLAPDAPDDDITPSSMQVQQASEASTKMLTSQTNASSEPSAASKRASKASASEESAAQSVHGAAASVQNGTEEWTEIVLGDAQADYAPTPNEQALASAFKKVVRNMVTQLDHWWSIAQKSDVKQFEHEIVLDPLTITARVDSPIEHASSGHVAHALVPSTSGSKQISGQDQEGSTVSTKTLVPRTNTKPLDDTVNPDSSPISKESNPVISSDINSDSVVQETKDLLPRDHSSKTTHSSQHFNPLRHLSDPTYPFPADHHGRFSWEFIQYFLGGSQISPGVYHTPRANPPFKYQTYWLIDAEYEPFMPSNPGLHAAKLTLFVRDGVNEHFPPHKALLPNTPLFIRPYGQTHYRYHGNFTLLPHADPFRPSTVPPHVSRRVHAFWAEALASPHLPAWVVRALPSLLGPPKSDLEKTVSTPSSTDLTADAAKPTFAPTSKNGSQGLKLWMRYLRCVAYDVGFYEQLMILKSG